MYTIFQHLYAVSKNIEIYTDCFFCKIVHILRKRPKLLLAAVILFGSVLSVLKPASGLGQIILGTDNQNKPVIDFKDESLSLDKKDSFSLQSPYLTANPSAVFVLPSSGVLAVQVEPTAEPGKENQEKVPLASLYKNALLVQAGPVTFISQEPRTGIISYVVQEGDTPSTIAAFLGITTDTLLWANKLQETSVIRPGDELTIPPVSGVIHRVKSGQTVGWIANYYKADKDDIIGFNDLPADGQIIEGEQLVVPNGVMPAPVQPKPKYIAKTPSQSYVGAGTGKSRIFPYGQCTYYVAQKRVVSWSGDAKNWISNAQAMGYSVCRGSQCEPKVGAIISLGGDSWLIRRYGHVAYVESINGDWVTFSEMNYLGWAVKSVRTLHKNSSLIRGYIY
jgi:surface antigen